MIAECVGAGMARSGEVRDLEINTAMQKMKSLKKFLCTQERVRREYRGLIFCICWDWFERLVE